MSDRELGEFSRQFRGLFRCMLRVPRIAEARFHPKSRRIKFCTCRDEIFFYWTCDSLPEVAVAIKRILLVSGSNIYIDGMKRRSAGLRSVSGRVNYARSLAEDFS